MKKLVTACAACALAGAVFAQVESVNIVGYQTSTINPTGSLIIGGGKLNMLGLNWQAVGGGSYAIQDFFGGDAVGAGLIGNADGGLADQIQVWGGAGYSVYYLSDGTGYAELDNKWIKFGGDGTATTDTLTPGTGFWLVSRSTGSNEALVQAGEVKPDLTATLNLFGTGVGFGGLTMFANPYPADIVLNGTFDWSAAGATGNADGGLADQMQVWGGAGYSVYYLSDGTGYVELDNKWIKFGGDGTATTDVLPAGAGAWYKTVSAANWSLTLPRPY